MQLWHKFIQEQRELLPLKKVRRPKVSGLSRQMILADASLLNFVSNDYLGLSSNKRVKEAMIQAIGQYGVGSGGAPSLSGYSQEQELLCQRMAKWLGFEACLIFNSGYQMAIGLLPPLIDHNCFIWLDKNCHASHIDGVLLAKAKFSTFNQDSIEQVLRTIRQRPDQRHILLTEGSFSMDGSCSYLARLIEFKQSADLFLIVDDAHGIAALGENGFGSLEQQGLDHTKVDLLIGTFGKAFGSHGGFVCANNAWINYLEQTARSQIYSTCLPAAVCAASNASLSLCASPIGQQLRQRLKNNIALIKLLCAQSGLQLYQPATNLAAVQLLVFKDEKRTDQVYQQLLAAEILTGRITYPTVSRQSPRIRISLTAQHTPEDIEHLCQVLTSAVNRYGN